MRRGLLLVALLLAAQVASAHSGHDHNQTLPAQPAKPGPSPGPTTPARNSSANATAVPATASAAPTGLPGFGATTSSPGTREWLGYKGDPMRTGANGARAPVAPEPRWTVAGTPGTGIYASPVVAHGLVVFAGLDRKVHAVDANTGFGRWAHPLPSMGFSSPAIADDKVLVASSNGTLVALDLATGNERWVVELGGRVSASPLALLGVVYAQTEEGRVVALDAADGKLRWNRTLPPIESGVAPMWQGGRLYVGDAKGTVHALHALTGQTLWTASVATPVTATPVGTGKQVIVPTLGLKALEADSGRVAWAKPTAGFVRSSPAYQAGVLVYGNPEEPGVVGANAANGERLWSVSTRLFVRSAPAIAQDVAVVASDDGSLLAMRLRNGTLLWTIDAGERMRASPVVLDGVVYAARMDGLLRHYSDDAAPSTEPSEQLRTGGNDLGVLGFVVLVGALGVPYFGVRHLRQRVAAQHAGVPTQRLVEVQRPGLRGAAGFVGVACPRCACRFGVAPQDHSIVACPGCGLRSVVRRRGGGGGRGAPLS